MLIINPIFGWSLKAASVMPKCHYGGLSKTLLFIFLQDDIWNLWLTTGGKWLASSDTPLNLGAWIPWIPTTWKKKVWHPS